MKLCPICIAVSGIWISLVALRTTGTSIDPALIATLAGGSAVGIAYTLNRHIAVSSSAQFKFLFIPPTLATAYGIAAESWILAATGSVLASVVAILFRAFSSDSAPGNIVKEIEQKLENCCR